MPEAKLTVTYSSKGGDVLGVLAKNLAKSADQSSRFNKSLAGLEKALSALSSPAKLDALKKSSSAMIELARSAGAASSLLDKLTKSLAAQTAAANQASKQTAALASASQASAASVRKLDVSAAKAAGSVDSLKAAGVSAERSLSKLAASTDKSAAKMNASFTTVAANARSSFAQVERSGVQAMGAVEASARKSFSNLSRDMGKAFSSFSTQAITSVKTELASLASQNVALAKQNAVLTNSFSAQNAAAQVLRGTMHNFWNLMGGVGRVAMITALVHLGGITTALVGQAKAAYDVNAQFKALEITLRSAFRSAGAARQIRDELANITAYSAIPFVDLATIMRSFSVLPSTRGLISKQITDGNLSSPAGFLRGAEKLVAQMLAFRPDKQADDAIFSIREAMAGEFRSLVRRFDIPLSLVSQLSGENMRSLSGQPMAIYGALQKAFDRIVSPAALMENVRQPRVTSENIREQLFSIPSLRVGDAGFYQEFSTTLANFLYGSLEGEMAKLFPASGGPLAKDMSASLTTIFRRLTDSFGGTVEGVLDSFGFGRSRGGSTIQRSFEAVNFGLKELARNMPRILEAMGQFGAKMLTITTMLGTALGWLVDSFSSNPILTGAGLMAATTALPPLVNAGLGAAVSAIQNRLSRFDPITNQRTPLFPLGLDEARYQGGNFLRGAGQFASDIYNLVAQRGARRGLSTLEANPVTYFGHSPGPYAGFANGLINPSQLPPDVLAAARAMNLQKGGQLDPSAVEKLRGPETRARLVLNSAMSGLKSFGSSLLVGAGNVAKFGLTAAVLAVAFSTVEAAAMEAASALDALKVRDASGAQASEISSRTEQGFRNFITTFQRSGGDIGVSNDYLKVAGVSDLRKISERITRQTGLTPEFSGDGRRDFETMVSTATTSRSRGVQGGTVDRVSAMIGTDQLTTIPLLQTLSDFNASATHSVLFRAEQDFAVSEQTFNETLNNLQKAREELLATPKDDLRILSDQYAVLRNLAYSLDDTVVQANIERVIPVGGFESALRGNMRDRGSLTNFLRDVQGGLGGLDPEQHAFVTSRMRDLPNYGRAELRDKAVSELVDVLKDKEIVYVQREATGRELANYFTPAQAAANVEASRQAALGLATAAISSVAQDQLGTQLSRSVLNRNTRADLLASLPASAAGQSADIIGGNSVLSAFAPVSTRGLSGYGVISQQLDVANRRVSALRPELEGYLRRPELAGISEIATGILDGSTGVEGVRKAADSAKLSETLTEGLLAVVSDWTRLLDALAAAKGDLMDADQRAAIALEDRNFALYLQQATSTSDVFTAPGLTAPTGFSTPGDFAGVGFQLDYFKSSLANVGAEFQRVSEGIDFSGSALTEEQERQRVRAEELGRTFYELSQRVLSLSVSVAEARVSLLASLQSGPGGGALSKIERAAQASGIGSIRTSGLRPYSFEEERFTDSNGVLAKRARSEYLSGYRGLVENELATNSSLTADSARQLHDILQDINLEMVSMQNNNEKTFGSFGKGFANAATSMADMRTEMLRLGEQTGTRFVDGIADGFVDVAIGAKTAGEAIRAFAADTLVWLAKVFVRMALMQTFSWLFGGFGGAGGGAEYVFDVPTRHYGGPIARRATGGGVGQGYDSVRALLTPGEYVISRPAVSHYGERAMRAINTGQARMFSTGGGVGFEMPGMRTATAAPASNVVNNTTFVTINRDGSAEVKTESDDAEMGRIIARAVNAEVHRVLTDEMRPDGKIARFARGRS